MHRSEHTGAQIRSRRCTGQGRTDNLTWTLGPAPQKKDLCSLETTRPDLFRGTTRELKKQLSVGFLKLIRKQKRPGWGSEFETYT